MGVERDSRARFADDWRARVDGRLDGLETEERRTRKRLHDLETDRATIRLLAGQLRQFVDHIEETAVRAATAAIDQHELDRRAVWGYRLKWLGALTAGGAFAAELAIRVF